MQVITPTSYVIIIFTDTQSGVIRTANTRYSLALKRRIKETSVD